MKLPALARRRLFRVSIGVVSAAAAIGLSGAVPAAAAAPSASDVRQVCAAPTTPDTARCLSLIRTDVKARAKAQVSAAAAPTGYGPPSLQSAYKLPSAIAGGGRTVAVVDAYDDPNAAADLAAYRAQYGLPACTAAGGCFTKVNEQGQSSPLPTASGSTGWATEESLDIDMVSAVCPNCRILLVEANSPNFSDLGTGVNSAVTLGAKFVSNSYGGAESSSESTEDSAYYNHPGVAVTASAGDDGYSVSYPAASPDVVAVGGTSLSAASNSRGWTESVWTGTGSGCSAYEAKPSWQTDTGCTRRTDNDVSAVADPNTGLAVYDSYDQGGWIEVGGTSASSPIVAATYALAGNPPAGSYPAAHLYSATGSLFDVTSGTNGSCSPAYLCTAGAGYDAPTGLGTPNGAGAFTSGGSGNGYGIAYEANTQYLWTAANFGTASTGLGMWTGTNPADATLTNGGNVVAFQANTSALWIAGAAGTGSLNLGMMAGTSPAITALPGGGYEIAFQANTGSLWTTGTDGTTNWSLGMDAKTSPGITALPGGGYEAAFEANTNVLWTASSGGGGVNTGQGMWAGTDPAIATLAGGGTEVAFEASSGDLVENGAGGNNTTNQAMWDPSSPGIAALPGGGFQVAYDSGTSALWTTGSLGTGNLGYGMWAGSNPSIAALPTGGYQIAFEANTSALWVTGTDGSGNLGLGMYGGTSPSIAALP